MESLCGVALETVGDVDSAAEIEEPLVRAGAVEPAAGGEERTEFEIVEMLGDGIIDAFQAGVEAGGEAFRAGESEQCDQSIRHPFAAEKADTTGEAGVAVEDDGQRFRIERLAEVRVSEIGGMATGTAQRASGKRVDERDFVGHLKGSYRMTNVAKAGEHKEKIMFFITDINQTYCIKISTAYYIWTQLRKTKGFCDRAKEWFASV